MTQSSLSSVGLQSRGHLRNHLLTAMVAMALFLPVVPSSSRAQDTSTSESERDSPAGNWRGESMCVVRQSACHDEDSLYHVAPLGTRAGWFVLRAGKIVNGKSVTMGTSDCSYNQTTRSLNCALARATLQFEIQGDLMHGTMTLPDGTVWRRLSLKRVPGGKKQS